MFWKQTACPVARHRTPSLVLGALLVTSSLLLLPGCGGNKTSIPSEPPPDARAPLPAGEQQTKDQQISKQALDEKGDSGGPAAVPGAPPPK